MQREKKKEEGMEKEEGKQEVGGEEEEMEMEVGEKQVEGEDEDEEKKKKEKEGEEVEGEGEDEGTIGMTSIIRRTGRNGSLEGGPWGEWRGDRSLLFSPFILLINFIN